MFSPEAEDGSFEAGEVVLLAPLCPILLFYRGQVQAGHGLESRRGFDLQLAQWRHGGFRPDALQPLLYLVRLFRWHRRQVHQLMNEAWL